MPPMSLVCLHKALRQMRLVARDVEAALAELPSCGGKERGEEDHLNDGGMWLWCIWMNRGMRKMLARRREVEGICLEAHLQRGLVCTASGMLRGGGDVAEV